MVEQGTAGRGVGLGDEVRARRVGLGLTLDALAARSHVSRAMLSEIERGAKSPTINVVCRVAEALGCTVSQLLGELPVTSDAPAVVRLAERRVLVDPRSRVERHLLSPTFHRHGIEVLWYLVPPCADTGDFPPHRAGVEEHLTVVRGALECRIGEHRLTLAAGDSVSFAADVLHGFYNPRQEPCEYLLLIDSSRAGRTS